MVVEGEDVAVGTVIATISGATERMSPVQRKRISPRAKAVAAQLGVDPQQLSESGAVTEEAVRRAALASQQVVSQEDGGAMRRAIARTMSRSKREIPHYYLATTIDMTAGLEWLTDRNAAATMEARIIPAALLLKATALAAREVAGLNGHYDGGKLTHDDGVHLGVAISLRDGGLVAPAIRDCADKSLGAVMDEMADLV